MNSNPSQPALRCEAVRRRLGGERRKDICAALGHSTSWFDKWWAVYRHHPSTDFADRSRAPKTSPSRTRDELVQAVVSVRQTLEAAVTPETRYGLIGPRAVRTHLGKLGWKPPSTTTIGRILREHGLTHPIGAGQDSAFYPWLVAQQRNAIHATDIITRRIRGGAEVQSFHTIDHYSHAVYLSQHTDKSSATAAEHLRACWSQLGLPQLQQLDNEDAFRGGHAHPRVIGQVVRLCLFCGVQVLFTPYYEAKRNYQIETFHSLWNRAFWSRHKFRDCAEVRSEVRCFEHWYHTIYCPPALQGRTPEQVGRGEPHICLTPDLQRLIPTGRLPITAGRIHFMRKVETTGQIRLLNETWMVGPKWMGEYICATIDTGQQTLSFWHKRNTETPWRLLKARQFRLKETVEPLLPAFRRNRTRCLDYMPG